MHARSSNGISDRLQFKLYGGTTVTAGINGRF